MALLSFAGKEGRKKNVRGCFIFSSLSRPALWVDDINLLISEVGELRKVQKRRERELQQGIQGLGRTISCHNERQTVILLIALTGSET